MTTVLRLSETHKPDPDANLSEHTLGRRVALKNWFHNLYREMPDEQFDGDECLSLEEAESLVLIPSFKLVSVPCSTESSSNGYSPEKQNHSHRDKMRDFRIHLKGKLSHFKHRYDRGILEDGHRNKHGTSDRDGDTGRHVTTSKIGNCQVQDLSSELVECKAELKKIEVKLSPHNFSAEVLKVKSDEGRSSSSLERQVIAGQPPAIESATLKPARGSEGSCRMKRQSNDDEYSAFVKRPCSSKEIGSNCSLEKSVDISDANQLEEDTSIEKTPSAYLPNLSTDLEAVTKRQCSAIAGDEPAADSSFDNEELDSDSMESSDDFSSSEDTSLSDEISITQGDPATNLESCIPPVIAQKVYTIPTFRKKVRSLNVASIARSFREGTLSQDQLIEMGSNGVDGHTDLTFRNKEFYDDISPNTSSINAVVRKDNKVPSQKLCSKGGDCHEVEIGNSGGTVRFDRFSCLVVYETTSNSNATKSRDVATIRGCEGIVSLSGTTKSVVQDSSGTGIKSILKVKSNLRADVENKRASDCDRVGVDSFMDLFEHFEHKKQMEECMLAEVREGQLNNYFSENFFPEILEDISIATAANSEFSRSRKATESNIGRKLGAINCDSTHYVCNQCELPVLAPSLMSKAT